MTSPAFGKVERRSATRAVVDEIRGLILERRLEPGDALPAERELASSLGVSRNALREALGILAQQGLVVARQGQGTFVSTPSGGPATDALALLIEFTRVDLIELSEARLLIEPELAARAAETLDDAGAERLRIAAAELDRTAGDPERHVRSDAAFHALIAELAGRPLLAAIVAAVREPIERGMLVGTTIPDALARSDEQHRALLDAILGRDAPRARDAMRAHLDYVRDYLTAARPTLEITE